jgi:DNA-binding MarR family transcriptional regulator
MYEHEHEDQEQLRARFHQTLITLFKIEDASGIEIFTMIHRITHLSPMLDSQPSDELDISGPRWRLMLSLLIQEQFGYTEGITPTVLSHAQRVSKNTISALLRGLEEQGLIQRNLDPKDLRIFRIQLTQAGRELLLNTAPKRLERLNQLVSGLSPQERAQIKQLLEKLLNSLSTQLHDSEENRIPVE